MQMQRLIFGPFKAAVQGSSMGTLAERPFLIVIDGLDECEDKDEVQDLIDGMLAFFTENPFIPLRVFITSRVEQHIQSRLNVPGVRLENLVDHCSDNDIATFLDVLFEDERRRNPVIQAYAWQHGEWPTPSEKWQLVEHIGGSFIFASAVFKFIMGWKLGGADGPGTPMDRLPLALKMNPGLDGLYAQTLARSEHLPYFSDIISTIALLESPLPTSGIAELLGIRTYEVVNVLVNLQAIVQVPGTDNMPVTLCHTSLRDFLTTQSRSHRFFAHPSLHVRLFLRCIECELELRRQRPGGLIHARECVSAVGYALSHSAKHHSRGRDFFKLSASNSAIHLRREILAVYQVPESMNGLANVILSRFRHTGSLVDLGEAISLLRESLRLRPPPHPDRASSLKRLANALQSRYRLTQFIADLEEAISLLREAVTLGSSPSRLLGDALLLRYHHMRSMPVLEEAISLLNEALRLRPAPHPDRSASLNNLGAALLDRYLRAGSTPDLEQAISIFREALGLRASSHPLRSVPLGNLVISLQNMYKKNRALPHLQEAILYSGELLESHYPVGHENRAEWLGRLTSLLEMRFDATGREEDFADIARLKEEAYRSST
ncbi:hypothetical protein H1R20_g6131, partial [Candolleomyces eurysporus]